MLALAPFFLASSLISSSLAATFNVDVGNGGLVFTPNQINAVEGDEVIFNFFPKNHSVVQSTLASPCAPLTGGGSTGFVPVAAGTVGPTRRLVVPSSTAPLWFYCSQGTHCQSGMVFAINPGSQAKMDEFLANARGGAAAPGTSTTATTTPPVVSTTPPAATTTSDPASQPSASTPVTGTGREIIIDVGVNAAGQTALVFTPETATAVVGDKIIFQFKAGAHTATQSTFASPCSPLANGANSGPMPAAGLTSGFPNYTFPVTDVSKPIWFYCATGNHCNQGMVFSLNAPATGNTHDAFKAAAQGKPETQPGDGASSIFGGAVSSLLIAVALATLLL